MARDIASPIERLSVHRNGAFLFAVILSFALLVSGCSRGKEDSGSGAIKVPESGVTSLADLTVEDRAVVASATFTLPAGSIVEVDSENIAAVRSITKVAHPLAEAGILDLSSGDYSLVLPQAIKHSEGFDIVDVRATDTMLMWVEAKAADGAWAVYSASLSGATPGEAILLEEGTSDYLLPSIAVSGSTAIWLHAPDPEKDKSEETTEARARDLGAAESRVLYATDATVRLPLRVCNGVVTITQRELVAGTRRSEIVAVGVADAKTLDRLVLPAPIAPSDAVYLEGAFTFAVPAKYDGVGPLGSVGTYLQTGEASFIRLTKQPLDTPTRKGAFFVAKEGKSTAVVDAAAKTYFLIPAIDNAPDYGDYLSVNGSGSRVVTFTQPTPTDGTEPYTIVRMFSF